MADSKLSALTALGATPAIDDLIYMESGGVSKSVTAAFLRGAKVSSIIASGSLALNTVHLVTLNLGTAIALTITGAPAAGDILAIYRKGSGGVTHTVTLSGSVKWNSSNNTIASFDTDAEVLIAWAETATRWIVLYQSGVAFS